MSIDLRTLWDLTDDTLAALSPDARAELEAAARLLERAIKPDRVLAVVRRPAPFTEGRSLLELAHEGRMRDLHAYVVAMFNLRRIAP
jgi:hypothetical protein